MKKLLIIVLLLAEASLAFGQKTVATVNFSVRRTIGAGNLGENAAFLKDIFTLANDPRFDLNPVLNTFYTNFNEDLAGDLPFNLLSEEQVLGNSAYANYVSENVDTTLQYYIMPEGFKPLVRPILGGWQGDKKAMLDIFKDQVQGILFVYVYFDFDKTTVMGVGVAKIMATYNMVCYNAEGKKVFDLYRSANSKKSVPMVAGYPILKLEKIQPLCESAAEELLADVKSKLPKIVKKAGKKL